VNTRSPIPSFNPQLASGTPEPNFPFLIFILAPSSEGLNFLVRISNALHAIQAKYTAAFFGKALARMLR
jgi:hypothetical protein